MSSPFSAPSVRVTLLPETFHVRDVPAAQGEKTTFAVLRAGVSVMVVASAEMTALRTVTVQLSLTETSPVVAVAVIVAVPAPTAETSPEESTVATEVLELDQATLTLLPPAVSALSCASGSVTMLSVRLETEPPSFLMATPVTGA